MIPLLLGLGIDVAKPPNPDNVRFSPSFKCIRTGSRLRAAI